MNSRRITFKIEDPDKFFQQNWRIDADGNLYVDINEGDFPKQFPKFIAIAGPVKEE